MFLKRVSRNELEVTSPRRNSDHTEQERTSLFARLVFQNVRVIKTKQKTNDLPSN